MKPPTAKLTLADSSPSFIPFPGCERDDSSVSSLSRPDIRPFLAKVAAKGIKRRRHTFRKRGRSARDERQPRQRRKTAAPGTKDSRAKDERPQRQGRKTASPSAKDRSTPGTKNSCASKTGRYRPLRRRATAEQMVRRLEGFAFFGQQDQAEGDGKAGDGAEEEFLAVLQGFYCFQEEGLIRLEGLDGI